MHSASRVRKMVYVANLRRIVLCLLVVIFVWPTGPRIQSHNWRTVDPVHLLDSRCLSAGGKHALAVCSFPCLRSQIKSSCLCANYWSCFHYGCHLPRGQCMQGVCAVEPNQWSPAPRTASTWAATSLPVFSVSREAFTLSCFFWQVKYFGTPSRGLVSGMFLVLSHP